MKNLEFNRQAFIISKTPLIHDFEGNLCYVIRSNREVQVNDESVFVVKTLLAQYEEENVRFFLLKVRTAGETLVQHRGA